MDTCGHTLFGIRLVIKILFSVTTELEQATALKYLYGWLRNHPKYGAIAPPELADSLYHADVSALSFLNSPQLNLNICIET